MSNENSSTNHPRAFRQCVSTRARKFSCITYLNKSQLDLCLLLHERQIRCYAYAYHDMDTKEDGSLKEPHFHIILITYNACTLSAIRRWFSGYVDKNGDITTTAQICSDVFEMYDYLTHSTKEAIASGKYQYDKSIVCCSDMDYFKAGLRSNYDTVTLATEMLLKGISVREVGQIFGRDFILHYPAIKRYLTDVYLQEHSSLDNLSSLIDFDLSYKNL